MVLEFFEFFRFQMDKTNFKRLYRGSSNGFGPWYFHKTCDGHSNTITIIETTLGYIFGGFTRACWSSSLEYKFDNNAYIFSFKNKFGKKYFCKVIDASNAILCSPKLGPSFGKYDIYISFNSSNITLLKSYENPFLRMNFNFFCDSDSFRIKEIEVFEVS